jgi:hypothetical protein
VNEPDVHGVVRHLVDEVGRAAFAENTRLLEIPLAERAPFRSRERRHSLEEDLRLIRSFAAGKLARELREDLKLHRPLDERVAREDLLDERRSGARQPENEDGIGSGSAGSGACGEELAREQPLGAAYVVRILIRAVRHHPAANGVAFGVMRERFPAGGAILERLA